MNTLEFTVLCNLNKIDTAKIVIGYNTYNIITDKSTFEYQSLIFYDLNTDTYSEYDLEYNDIKKQIKNNNVLKVELIGQTVLVEIKTKRRFGLPNKYMIEDINTFLKYNANS